jgi:hypothetical protein
MPSEFEPLTFEIDHIIARKHGGESSLDNLALSCFRCNCSKGPNIAGVDPDTNEIVRLFNPRQDAWSDHFEWDGPVLLGRTPIGRTTIEVLNINLNHRVAHRQFLLAEGEFPTQPAT